MRPLLLTSVAVLAVMAISGCSETATELTGVEADALVTSAADWIPSDIAHDLPVDDATRLRIDSAMVSFHASLMELRDRHMNGQRLTGAEREEFMGQLHEDVVALHARHQAIWDSLTPEVQDILRQRFHEKMHGDGSGASLHERMRALHGGDHGG